MKFYSSQPIANLTIRSQQSDNHRITENLSQDDQLFAIIKHSRLFKPKGERCLDAKTSIRKFLFTKLSKMVTMFTKNVEPADELWFLLLSPMRILIHFSE